MWDKCARKRSATLIRGMRGQGNNKCAAGVSRICEPQLTAVRFGDPARDGQAQPCAAALLLFCAGARLVYAIEPLEDVCLRFGGNADAGIGHRELMRSVVAFEVQPDGTSSRCEFDRVVEQVK